MQQVNQAYRCACGNPTKVFSTGRVAEACSEACSRIATRRKSGAKPLRVCWLRKCWDCGKKISARAAFCMKCLAVRRFPNAKARPCKGCGKMFKPRQTGNKGLYCSRECAFTNIKMWKKPRARNVLMYCKVWFMDCVVCGKHFVARNPNQKFCSEDCRYSNTLELLRKNYRKNYIKKPIRILMCTTCGTRFNTSRWNARYCSSPCVPKRTNARDRARHAGVHYEAVNAIRVFDRDGWRCQICGTATPRERRGTRYSNAPELDHRVPLSRGGPHSYENVQCTCRACNGEKGSLFNTGQLPLFNHEHTVGRSVS